MLATPPRGFRRCGVCQWPVYSCAFSENWSPEQEHEGGPIAAYAHRAGVLPTVEDICGIPGLREATPGWTDEALARSERWNAVSRVLEPRSQEATEAEGPPKKKPAAKVTKKPAAKVTKKPAANSTESGSIILRRTPLSCEP